METVLLDQMQTEIVAAAVLFLAAMTVIDVLAETVLVALVLWRREKEEERKRVIRAAWGMESASRTFFIWLIELLV